ncbi:MAG TPA: outer membrane beta-barrel domain-containing protein [Myxococcota bacterium]|nr:outer membrane beta-barrel domain-containing protein [Myxococcota bacterium]HOA12896.1 outer membrane beta-barrel domain-containing protein [Myxococcota bacterium]HOD00559.1 outer membrane beta-barrel domain-containing protein [Myxococcota bacterium]HOH75983.1 outer membrane beta-barrel domain-containing protein [Myxococcota bacterium]HPV04426.1 outer membrane beta-barrel domain-containing protein [Myxococcota bacterium]
MKRIAILLAVVLLPVAVSAQEASLADAPSVRHQKLIRGGRHELTPAFGVTINQKYNTDLLFQLSYEYHFYDFFSAGLEIGYAGVGFRTGQGKIIGKMVDEYAQSSQNPTDAKFGRSGLGLLALAKVSFVPLAGKIVLGGKHLGYADIHLTAGVGFGTVSYYDWDNPPGSSSVAAMVGGGVRFFPIELIGLTFDVRDYMVLRKLSSTDKKAELSQNPTFIFGVSFFLPEVKRGR